jgi:hypothetical protein
VAITEALLVMLFFVRGVRDDGLDHMEDGVFLGAALHRARALRLYSFCVFRSSHRSFIGVHSGRVVFMEERRGDLYVVRGDVHGCV